MIWDYLNKLQKHTHISKKQMLGLTAPVFKQLRPFTKLQLFLRENNLQDNAQSSG